MRLFAAAPQPVTLLISTDSFIVHHCFSQETTPANAADLPRH